MFVATKLLSSQNYVWHDKITFVVTKLLSRQKYFMTILSRQPYFVAAKRLVATKVLSWQFRRDKHTFLATKDVFCQDEHKLGTDQAHSISSAQVEHEHSVQAKHKLRVDHEHTVQVEHKQYKSSTNTQYKSSTNMFKNISCVCIVLKKIMHPENILSRQAYFCRDKHVFVTAKIILVAAPANDSRKVSLSRQNFCRDKNVYMMTKVLSRQEYFYCDKRRVLSRQTCLSWQNFCRDINDTCGSSRHW